MNSTADYVNDSFKSRNKTAAKMFRKLDAGKEYDGQDASDAIAEWPLSVEEKIHVVIVISTGGPHEEIDCEVSKGPHGGYVLDRATFGAYWGSDKRETRLDESDALWRLAEYYLESMGY